MGEGGVKTFLLGFIRLTLGFVVLLSLTVSVVYYLFRCEGALGKYMGYCSFGAQTANLVASRVKDSDNTEDSQDQKSGVGGLMLYVVGNLSKKSQDWYREQFYEVVRDECGASGVVRYDGERLYCSRVEAEFDEVEGLLYVDGRVLDLSVFWDDRDSQRLYFDKATKVLVIEGGNSVDLSALVDRYKAGAGLLLTDNTFSLDAILSDLKDVDTKGALAGDVLKFDGSKWIPASDQDTTYTAGGQLLYLTGTTFKIKEGTLTDGRLCSFDSTFGLVCNTDSTIFLQTLNLSGDVLSISDGNSVTFTNWDTDVTDDVRNLSDLLDVTLNTPSASEVLVYNGIEWINQPLNFLALSDTSSTYGPAGYLLQSTGSGIAYVDPLTLDVGYWKRVGTTLSPRNAGDDVVLNPGETLSIQDFSIGGLIYASNNGLLVQDIQNLYWDDTNKRLGIRTNNPLGALHIADSSTYVEKVSIAKTVTSNYTPSFGSVRSIVDSIYAPEGHRWDDANYAVRLDAANTSILTIDLGQVYDIERVKLQADGNDVYRVEYSVDGATWSLLFEAGTLGAGLLTRDSGPLTPVAARYVRVYAVGGDGLYSVSELEVQATVARSQLFVDNYKVGIGTLTPVGNLHIADEVYGIHQSLFLTSNAIRFRKDGISFFSIVGPDDTQDYLTLSYFSRPDYLADARKNILTLTPTGNVGIGTTTPAKKLDVIGDVKITPDGTARSFYFYNDGGFPAITADFVIRVRQRMEVWGNYIDIRTSGGTQMIYLPPSGNAFFMQGNVGIGVTNPSAKLHVYGGQPTYMKLESNASGGEASFIWKNLTGESYFGLAGATDQLLIGGLVSAGDLVLSHRTGGKIIFSADSTYSEAHLTISESGNVGVGTTNPTVKLDVVGGPLRIANAGYSTLRLVSTESGGRDYRIFTVGASDPSSSGKLVIRDATAGVHRFVLDSAGNVGIGIDAPSYRLTVASQQNVAAYFDSTASFTRIGVNSSSNAGIGLYINNVVKWSLAASDPTGSGASYGFSIWNDQLNQRAFFVDGGTNNIGIGTFSPSAKLTLFDGNLLLESQDATSTTPLIDSGLLTLQGEYWDGTQSLPYGFSLQTILESTTPTARLSIQNNAGTELFVIDESGNVGIGVSSPVHKLAVEGWIRSNYQIIPQDPIFIEDFDTDNSAQWINTNPTYLSATWDTANSRLVLTNPSTTNSYAIYRYGGRKFVWNNVQIIYDVEYTAGGVWGGPTIDGTTVEGYIDANTKRCGLRGWADANRVVFPTVGGTYGDSIGIGRHKVVINIIGGSYIEVWVDGKLCWAGYDNDDNFRKGLFNFGIVSPYVAGATFYVYKIEIRPLTFKAHTVDAYSGLFAPGSAYLATLGGNVGINTTSPLGILDILKDSGQIYFQPSDITADNQLKNSPELIFRGKYDSDSTTGFATGTYDFKIKNIIESTTPTARLSIQNNAGTELFVIDEVGKVGIRTIDPRAELHIYGRGFSDKIRLQASTSTEDNWITSYDETGTRMWIINMGDRSVNNNFAIYSELVARYVFSIDTSGNVGIGTTAPTYTLQVGTAGDGTSAIANAWNTFSDIRWKENIEKIDSQAALETVLNLRGVKFEWKESGKPSIGFIAQEVKDVIPEIVSQDDRGYYSLDYTKLIPYLVEAIKELAKQVGGTESSSGSSYWVLQDNVLTTNYGLYLPALTISSLNATEVNASIMNVTSLTVGNNAFSVDSSGNLIVAGDALINGTLEVKTIISDIIETNTIKIKGDMASKVTIPAGETQVEVVVEDLTPDDVVVVSPVGAFVSYRLIVNNGSFVIELSNVLQEDVTFNYIILKK